MKLSRAHDSAAEDQAALWAAKLDGSALSAAEREQLDTWLATDPRHRALLSQYCQFSADLEQQLPLLVVAGAVELPAEAAPVPRRSRKALWFATTLAAAAAVAAGIWTFQPAHQSDTIATSVAQRKTLKLADGTVVELNARTSLLVDLTGKERHVRMADGEAFFTVAKDKTRPFIVETPAGSVRVTGTVFDVHADTTTDLAVTVVEGSVQVNPCQAPNGRPSAPVSLRANDQLVVTNGIVAPKQSLNADDLENALAWRHGEVVFNGTPLESALAHFARYHGRAITVAPEVATLRVGGRYNLDDLDAFLSAVEALLPVQVSPQSSGAIAVTPRAGS